MEKGDWLYNTGEECEKCYEKSVEAYENGDEICEECGWNKIKKRSEYVQDN